MSIGCAGFNGELHDEVHRKKVVNLIDHADSALYVAKETGGGRVERRRARRVALDDVPVEIEAGSNRYTGQVVDYSDVGLGLQVSGRITGDQPVRVYFDREQIRGERGNVKGKVAWVTHKIEDGVYLAGVETEEPPPLQL